MILSGFKISPNKVQIPDKPILEKKWFDAIPVYLFDQLFWILHTTMHDSFSFSDAFHFLLQPYFPSLTTQSASLFLWILNLRNPFYSIWNCIFHFPFFTFSLYLNVVKGISFLYYAWLSTRLYDCPFLATFGPFL